MRAANHYRHLKIIITIVLCFAVQAFTYANDSDEYFIEFDDTPLSNDITLPPWFKLSFLEVNIDLKEAEKNGKQGLILYFGQKDCAYCKAHLEKNWKDRGITTYTRKYFDVVAIDVRGDQPVIGIKGQKYLSEKSYAVSLGTNFTPTLIFYNLKGDEVLRLSGYRPPYQFRASLEFVSGKHFLNESFKAYMDRGEHVPGFEESELNDNSVFQPPPYALDRSKFPGQVPLAVFFESETCHACDILHGNILKDKAIISKLQKIEAVQLDIKSDTPVMTPSGLKLTARQWADKLGIYYSPTIVFFDANGIEILRIDSVVRFYRLNNVLQYILSNDYIKYPNFQQWRQAKNK